MLFENQPNFSIVSNGAECIMIEKKFYMENSSQAHIVKLKEMVRYICFEVFDISDMSVFVYSHIFLLIYICISSFSRLF